MLDVLNFTLVSMTIPNFYLLPNLLGNTGDPDQLFPADLANIVASLDGLVAESDRGARRFLGLFPKTKKPIREIPVAVLEKKKHQNEDLAFYFDPVLNNGETWGFISDSGLPILADPGADLVTYARKRGIPVVAVPGPSSVFLSLMLSGFPGQRFSFHGYLPKERNLFLTEVERLEKESKRDHSTQIFIESPHRNEHSFENCLEVLSDSCMLCVAWDLTLPTQQVMIHSAKGWKGKKVPDFHKKPAIFLVYKP